MKTKIRDLLARQGIQVALLVIALEVITYWSYFMRLTVVNGDANAHYLSDSYYWWNNGGIFNPPDWVAYTWMGRPAGEQYSGWIVCAAAGHRKRYFAVEPYGIVYHVGGARGSWRGGHVPVGPSADRAPPCFADRPRGAILRPGNLCKRPVPGFSPCRRLLALGPARHLSVMGVA